MDIYLGEHFFEKELTLKIKVSPYFHGVQKMLESFVRGSDFNPTKYPLKWMLKNKVDYPLNPQVGPHSHFYSTDPIWCADADILYDSSGKPHFQK